MGTLVVPMPGPLVTGDVESSRRAFEVTPQSCNACFEDHPGRDFVQLQTCPHMFCRTHVVLNPGLVCAARAAIARTPALTLSYAHGNRLLRHRWPPSSPPHPTLVPPAASTLLAAAFP